MGNFQNRIQLYHRIYRQLGNSWNIDTLLRILSNFKIFILRNEQIFDILIVNFDVR